MWVIHTPAIAYGIGRPSLPSPPALPALVPRYGGRARPSGAYQTDQGHSVEPLLTEGITDWRLAVVIITGGVIHRLVPVVIHRLISKPTPPESSAKHAESDWCPRSDDERQRA